VGDRPLLAQAVDRLEGLVPPERVLVITGSRLLEETRLLLDTVPGDNILGEPRAASTAPALAWATVVARARDPEAVILSLHADWHVGDDGAFRHAAARALDVAQQHDVLVTVGIVPTRPEVGYGYILPGEELRGDARRVKRFIEKPERGIAQQLIDDGALWNSGLFAWTADRFHAETQACAPEIAPHIPLIEAGDVNGFFNAVTPIAVDLSHFERSDRVAVVPGDFPWDDVGTWSALRRVRATDADENVIVGDATVRDCHGCVVWAEDGPVILDGIQDLVIVRARGRTLITTTERAARLKDLLETLPENIR
jgi:mannose-1-phosphate guanylyltransferase